MNRQTIVDYFCASQQNAAIHWIALLAPSGSRKNKPCIVRNSRVYFRVARMDHWKELSVHGCQLSYAWIRNRSVQRTKVLSRAMGRIRKPPKMESSPITETRKRIDVFHVTRSP